MTQLTENIIAIEVPVDASNFKMVQSHGQDIDLVFDSPSTRIGRGFKPVNGNYSFICASLTATEEEAGKIVGDRLVYDNGGIKDENGIDKLYDPWVETDWPYSTATETLDEFLRSKGLNPELNYAILRKQF